MSKHTLPIIMGVLNVTPDSFSDGSKFVTLEQAVARAQTLHDQGAGIIDVGGESTRPGATLVGAVEEQRRVIPVIRELSRQGFVISVDTINAATAEAAALAGAKYINDVSGGAHDDNMLATVARLAANLDVGYIIGHWRGVPDPAHARSDYQDVVSEVIAELRERISAAIEVGVPESSIVIDPGLGFDKTADQCWQILRSMPELHALGYPICIGASRKRMLADIVQQTTGEPGSATDRDLATAVVSALVARAGAWSVRVHDALGSAQALAVVAAWGQQPDHAAPAQIKQHEGGQRSNAEHATSDHVSITGLEVFAHHGVFEHERVDGQPFIIDIDAWLDLHTAARSDELSQTVHYGELATQVAEAVRNNPVDLIETVAERIASVALSFAPIQRVRVTVHKPQAPIDEVFADVAITIERFASHSRGGAEA